ncbi:hypothetical protein ACFY8F_32265 [Streptomyces tanashiensis]|uniref:hypothetical protein n=1 Tax=Streptomyces tanashiensis TaxID=67367 RepID=UPI003677D587
MTRWMRQAPRWAVATALALASVLLFVGAVSHITDLLRHGLRPYEWAPNWLNLYWTSLAFLDPLAAGLLISGRRRGMDLCCAIMATDITANWYAVYGIQHSGLLAQSGLQRLAVFTLLVLLVAPFLRRHLAD